MSDQKNRYTVRLMGFYGEVEIVCEPNSLRSGAELRRLMVEDATKAYNELKKARER